MKLIKNIMKMSIWIKLLILLLFVYLLQYNWDRYMKLEGFSNPNFIQNEKYVLKSDNLYDDFYATIYDDLVYSNIKNEFETLQLVNETEPNSYSKILDIGSGTGHHVSLLTQKGYDCIGVDNSQAMINKAKSLYPNCKFQKNDIMNAMIFKPNEFTHITCFYFTVYYFKDKVTFFNNCNAWLKPGGYLILHLVDRNNFDPIIPPSNPLHVISPQKYAKERIKTSAVKFKDFNYKASFDLNGDTATFTENIMFDKNRHIRTNKHVFYMEKQQSILSVAKDAGFILLSKIPMTNINFADQYLYVLQKPN